ncbi:MAG TPA: conjugative transposon protein TraM [bacterium]
MNIREVFNNLLIRFKGVNLSKQKRLIILVLAFILFLILMTVFSNKGTQKKSSFQNVSIMPRESSKSKKDLNYEFIKLDTIKIPSFTSSQEFQLAEKPEASEPLFINTDKIRPELQSTSQQATPLTASVKSAAPPVQASSLFPISSANRNPNMIITNNLAESQESANGSQSLYTGKQSALIKVMLPNRTPVANGSLVEARVLRDSNWGNLVIPRRTKLIGVASLFNRRVEIEFREIIINNSSRSCSGKAYDLKQLKGIAYSPVSSEAKRILVEELRDAVSGVPVVGRVANRATYASNYSDQDISELDEGLEFYVLVESVY